ncbi:hypothetical protein BJF78_16775 [Pseudonocardia sp. CNS-139]|nr:hypothetical protein BJF78_16775 [Pseudonocardia sp. CNS-139]
MPDQPRNRDGTFGRKGGGFLAALVAALALVGGASGVGGSVAGSGVTGATGGSGTAGGARSTQARQQDTTAARIRIEARSLRVDGERFDAATDCSAHAYGRVREFFREQQCVALYRASFEVRDRRNAVVLVAIAWVEMPDAATARAYHDLVDTHGTGNVTELTRERGRYQDVRFTGEHYASRRDGTTVVNAQAQPVGRAAAAAAELEQVVAEALGP